MPELPPLWEREKRADESWTKTAQEGKSLYRLHRNESGKRGKKWDIAVLAYNLLKYHGK